MITFSYIDNDCNVEISSSMEDMNIHSIAHLFERFLLAITFTPKTIKEIITYDENELWYLSRDCECCEL